MNGNKLRQICYAIIFFALTFCILAYSELSLSYAALGLRLWFDKMVPALFPFMIISGIMIRLNLTEIFVSVIYPPVRQIFHITRNVCYCLLIGFLCGFPMGAKTAADLYSFRKISRWEARYLLCFVNNIGPVYFLGFVLPLLHRKMILPYLTGMYLIPLLYGLFLRYTFFRDKLPASEEAARRYNILKAADFKSEPSLFQGIDDSIQSAVASILSLGGYMILFNLLNLIPHIVLKSPSLILAPLFEINGGISLIADSMPLYVLLLLPFGGFSCIAQTYSCIKDTDLKISEYLLHKAILTLLTGGFYLLWYLFSPHTFLS